MKMQFKAPEPMGRFVCPMEIKSVSDDGEVEGYAAVFGNVDDGGDIIEKGAFRDFEKTPDGKVLFAYSHGVRNGDLPIGKAEVWQDERGLRYKGQLVREDPFVQRVYAHMKARTLTAMSIGYRILPGGAEFKENGVRLLKALKLFEISVLPFGMNTLARVEAVKSAGQITSLREYEDFLRDAGGFSRAQAKLLASAGWKAMPGRRDADGEVDLKQLADEASAIVIPQFSL